MRRHLARVETRCLATFVKSKRARHPSLGVARLHIQIGPIGCRDHLSSPQLSFRSTVHQTTKRRHGCGAARRRRTVGELVWRVCFALRVKVGGLPTSVAVPDGESNSGELKLRGLCLELSK
jgi:hypothetical protein